MIQKRYGLFGVHPESVLCPDSLGILLKCTEWIEVHNALTFINGLFRNSQPCHWRSKFTVITKYQYDLLWKLYMGVQPDCNVEQQQSHFGRTLSNHIFGFKALNVFISRHSLNKHELFPLLKIGRFSGKYESLVWSDRGVTYSRAVTSGTGMFVPNGTLFPI